MSRGSSYFTRKTKRIFDNLLVMLLTSIAIGILVLLRFGPVAVWPKIEYFLLARLHIPENILLVLDVIIWGAGITVCCLLLIKQLRKKNKGA